MTCQRISTDFNCPLTDALTAKHIIFVQIELLAVAERPYKLIARTKIMSWFIEKKAISYLDEGILHFERCLKDYLPRPKHAVTVEDDFLPPDDTPYKYTAP